MDLTPALATQALDSALAGIGLADMRGRITYVNRSFLRMWGYDDLADVLGRPIVEFGRSVDDVNEKFAAVLNAGRWTGEVEAKKRTGELFFLEVSCSLVKDEEGQAVGIMASFIDVTARKRVEEALQESEERYRSLVESAVDPMFTSDANGRYLYVNTAAAGMLGTTPDQVIGKTVDELFPPHVAQAYRAGVSRVIGTGETLIAEEQSEVGGRTAWFSSVVQPVRDRHGQIAAAQAVVRDITHLKATEQALRESEERLRQAVRVAHIGMFDHDHVTGTIFWSPRQREIFGVGVDEPLSVELLGPTLDEQPARSDPLFPDDREWIAAKVRRAHEPTGDGLFAAEHRIVRRDGTVRWVTVRSQTFFEGEGDARRPVRTIGAVRDITEDKEAEEEQRVLYARLTQAQRMESVGRLAGGVAHDFNNMLNVIHGYAELALGRLASSDPLYEALEEIQNATRRSADLTRQLLAFARRQTMAPKVLDLNDVVAGSLKMLRRLVGEQIEQVWMPGNQLWAVRADPAQIDQILTNLVANARDAIAGVGRVTIRTENEVLDEAYRAGHAGAVPGAYVMLEVRDTGQGMDKETLAHIFEPFYTTKPEGQGTGLGLATVYGIVKQNEGFINVDSEPGVGTTVQVFLPRFTGPMVQAAAGASEHPKAGGETVLLVEDEPMVLRLSKTLLEKLGYTVLPASTPGEALRLAEDHAGQIQVLVTDVVMPEMNGRDLAKQLISADPKLKCLFLSGYPADAMASPGVIDEGIHFLQKPFSLNDLAAKVREALDR